jgi:hypothetical protein
MFQIPPISYVPNSIVDQLKLPHQWPEPITQLPPRRFTKLSLGSL